MKKLSFFLLTLLSIFTFVSCEEVLPELYGDIYGIVYDKKTSEPIRGAEVVLSPGNKTTVTGFNGQYEFKDLDPKQYELQVSAAGYNTNSRQVTAIAGESVTCDITLSAIESVVGISLDNNNFNFGSTHTEQTLVIKNTGNSGTVNWEITGIDVTWLKVSPMSGTIAQDKEVAVKLTVDRNKLAADEASTTFLVNAAGGSQSVRVNINKPTVTGIKGTVKDADDAHLIKDCLVKIATISEQKTTGEDGTFKFTALTAGEYTLTFEKSGYQKKTQTIAISTGELKDIDVILKPLTPFSVSEEVIDFADDKTEIQFSLINNSDTETSFTINDIPEWLTISHEQGRLNATSEKIITAILDRKEVSNGTYSHKIRISYQGRTQGDILLEVKFKKVETAVDCDVWDGKKAKDFAGGDGSKYEPYIIKTGGQLLLMKDYADKYFKLAGNIDLNNKNWLPIETFSGVLDGCGYTIYNLNIDREELSYRGLIGTLNGGTIKNLNVKGVKIKGNNAGAIAGSIARGSNATISGCHVTLTDGSVLRGTNVGGIVGTYNKNIYWTGGGSFIEDCTVESENNNVAINGTNAGGIAGEAYSFNIKNCHVYCNVNGESYIGGITGYYGTIVNCEYKGKISGTENVGGICGRGASIIACKAEADIEGNNYIGGLCGYNYYEDIIASYSVGTITAAAGAVYIGGIAGYSYNDKDIIFCYSATTCNHSKFVPVEGNSNYSVYDTENIAQDMEDDYSDYADYWNFENTWSWKGKVNGTSKQVKCPRLYWEE